jgi:hypothetical protein
MKSAGTIIFIKPVNTVGGKQRKIFSVGGKERVLEICDLFRTE